jgi:hypothetical protein
LNAGKSEKKIPLTLLADILGYSSVREIESVFPTTRRLQYGKYMSSTMNITINVRCADTAEPKALGFFGYRSTEEMYIGLRWIRTFEYSFAEPPCPLRIQIILT